MLCQRQGLRTEHMSLASALILLEATFVSTVGRVTVVGYIHLLELRWSPQTRTVLIFLRVANLGTTHILDLMLSSAHGCVRKRRTRREAQDVLTMQNVRQQCALKRVIAVTWNGMKTVRWLPS